MALTILIFSLISPFAFRVLDRKVFWFLNCLILLLASDFAIRYQDAFVDTTAFSWAEMGWCYAFFGLAWLVRFCKKQEDIFIPQPLILAPLISVRSLLTFSICLANTLFLIGISLLKLFSIQNAIDISSVLLVLFLFWTIANEFSIWLANDLLYTLKYMFKSKEHLDDSGAVQFKLEPVATKNHIFEISKILESYNDLTKHANIMMDAVTETNKKVAIAEIAFQVSHDIRSPLAALEMAVKGLNQLSEESRIFIRSSVSRIKDIANNLLQKNIIKSDGKEDFLINQEEKTVQLLSSLIDRIISEKRTQFRAKMHIEINSMLDEGSYGIFSEVNVREFMRVLSNLINNAIEALEDKKGRVLISLAQAEKHAVISITDSGKGIPAELLKVLGLRGGTFGKPSGSGLGLHHAIKTVESWGGHLKFESTPGLGTTVKIVLPLVKSASWFVESLHISENSKIIILDDDINIHQIWSRRFEKIDAQRKGVEVLNFSMPDQLSLWVTYNKNMLSNALFLIDYEFLGSDQVGLDVIQDLGIKSQSILITSHYEEKELRARCERLGVQLIPKDMAALVPIHIGVKRIVDAVLIDDDPLIRGAWEMEAKVKQKTLASFSTVEAFIKESHVFLKNIPVYVDVSLGNGVRGEDVAVRIFELGFLNIYLATGYNPERFSHLVFLKGVIGKYSPF